MTALILVTTVTLTGQIGNSGGEADFARSAALAKGSCVTVFVPATTPEGRSTILAQLPGAAGQIIGEGIHYVATEYGVAEWRGRDAGERALGLIQIAAPQFRAELTKSAQEIGLVPADQLAPRGVYPLDLETTVTFREGLVVHMRPIKAADERLFQRFFYSLSRQTVYNRFFSAIKSMPHEIAQRHVCIDYEREVTLLGLIQQEEREEIVAMGSYAVDPLSRMAEVALVVQDRYQRQGIGTWLLFYLGHLAQRRGLAGLRAEVSAANYPALRLVRQAGYQVETALREGYFTISYRFPAES